MTNTRNMKSSTLTPIVVLLALLIAVCFLPQQMHARLSRHWTYNEMFDRADLVVIARVIASHKTEERTTLPDYAPTLNVVGMITNFAIGLVLKGSKEIKTFELFHYAYASHKDEDATSNTPFLLNIKPGGEATFLLFLTKRDDGRYVPVTGQTDPAFLSVLELQGAAD
jgi:poly-D-alanine transfer protein DltD